MYIEATPESAAEISWLFHRARGGSDHPVAIVQFIEGWLDYRARAHRRAVGFRADYLAGRRAARAYARTRDASAPAP